MTLLMDELLGEETDVPVEAAERRRGLRVPQARPVKVYDASEAKYFGGQTADVSATGLRIQLPASAAVEPGKVVGVHVGLTSAGSALPNRRQMIPARVVWVDRSFTRGHVLAGIEFITSIAAHLDAA
ncbi:MAG TPA: PilZ domain-containing protein [Tepidisphaeraceae bacterium]|nr:PilZ domain-containing protein [Tepidisphaeraceae bacterium]